MASKIGILNTQILGSLPLIYPQHNPQTATPGLPVKAAEIIYQGVMVAYDPANSQAQSADPSMPATAVVIGMCEETVDNSLGSKGDLTIRPRAVVARLQNDGNVTAAQLMTRVRVVDDHTVGVPAGDHTDRFAGLCVGLDGNYVWVLLTPENAKRGPVQVALTSSQNATAAATDLGTSEALANALKANYNQLQTDVAALRTALIGNGTIGA